ncbi:MAG TPA: hypothetical protein VGH78_06510 [Solirubrobacteraceae bacterium]|jgi:hypothetical protein
MRFEDTSDPETQGQLAAEALDHVERELALVRERRRALDGVEGQLWRRRNRLEEFLIRTRGITWWQARRRRRRREALDGRAAETAPDRA